MKLLNMDITDRGKSKNHLNTKLNVTFFLGYVKLLFWIYFFFKLAYFMPQHFCLSSSSWVG